MAIHRLSRVNLAHKETYDKARILHRDISVGNILITGDGSGLLIDWDLSKHVKKLDENPQPRQSERTVSFTLLSPSTSADSFFCTPAIHVLNSVDEH